MHHIFLCKLEKLEKCFLVKWGIRIHAQKLNQIIKQKYRTSMEN